MPLAEFFAPSIGLAMLPRDQKPSPPQDSRVTVDGLPLDAGMVVGDQTQSAGSTATSAGTTYSSVVTAQQSIEFQPVYLLALIPVLLFVLVSVLVGRKRNNFGRQKDGFRRMPAAVDNPDDPTVRGRFRKVSADLQRRTNIGSSHLLKPSGAEIDGEDPDSQTIADSISDAGDHEIVTNGIQPIINATQSFAIDAEKDTHSSQTNSSPVADCDSTPESKMDNKDITEDEESFDSDDMVSLEEEGSQADPDNSDFDLSEPVASGESSGTAAGEASDDDSFDFSDADDFVASPVAGSPRDETPAIVPDEVAASAHATNASDADDLRMRFKEETIDQPLAEVDDVEELDIAADETQPTAVAATSDVKRKGGLIGAIGGLFTRRKKIAKTEQAEDEEELELEAEVVASIDSEMGTDVVSDAEEELLVAASPVTGAESSEEIAIEATSSQNVGIGGGEFDAIDDSSSNVLEGRDETFSSVDENDESDDESFAEMFADDSDADYQFDIEEKSSDSPEAAVQFEEPTDDEVNSDQSLTLQAEAVETAELSPAAVNIEEDNSLDFGDDFDALMESDEPAEATAVDNTPDTAEANARPEVLIDTHSEISDTEFVPGWMPEAHDESPLIEDSLLSKQDDENLQSTLPENMMADIQEQLDALRAENQSLVSDLEAAKTELSKIAVVPADVDRLHAVETELSQSNQEIESIKSERDALDQRCTAAEEQLQVLEAAEQEKQSLAEKLTKIEQDLSGERLAREQLQETLTAAEQEKQQAEARAETAEAAEQAAISANSEGMPTGSLAAISTAAVATTASLTASAEKPVDDDPFRLEPEQVKQLLKKLKHERKRRSRSDQYLEEANRHRNEVESQLQALRDELKTMAPAGTSKTGALISELENSQAELDTLNSKLEADSKKKH